MALTGAYQRIIPRDPHILTAGSISQPEAASQTFKAGTPVIYDAAGRIAAAGAAPAVVAGIALSDGQNGTAGQYNTVFYPLRANEQWQITLLETLAQIQLGLSTGDVGLVKDATTGLWYASTADAGAQARVVDFLSGPAGYSIGDTKATVYISFHAAKLQVT